MIFRSAFVTGGGSGLGRAFALELAARGASVCVTDVDEATAKATAELVRARGVPALGFACDVRDAAAFEKAVDAAERELGPLDLMVNNAGVMVGGDLGAISLEDWRFTIDVNLWGNIHGVHVCAPRFKARGRGHFLNVASIAGVLAAPETGPYNVTKAGILSLTETAYAELGKWGIGATALCPSAVRTGIFGAMRTSNPVHKKLAEKNAQQLGPREPDAIARIALDACERGDLYVFPQPDAKAIWLAKRLLPRAFSSLARTARTKAWLERSVEGA
jgi:NAD(P)-dependent dehydrogenase (short-subunit alcohol dehydrogenase family)